MSDRPDGVLRRLVDEGSCPIVSQSGRGGFDWSARRAGLAARVRAATATTVIGDTPDRWDQDPALPPRASACVTRLSTTPTYSMPGNAIAVAFNDFGFEPEPIDREALKAGPLRNEHHGS